ncbi:hypothetical protein LDENG_00209300 [Lucifuga dentata]|nr:hypothetical protein LDENG_00209300 [Lucifuga dentata]
MAAEALKKYKRTPEIHDSKIIVNRSECLARPEKNAVQDYLTSNSRMLCEVLLSSLWFLFVIFWVETISVWLFLCMFYQDRVFYHWGDGEFLDDPGQMIYMLNRVDPRIQRPMQT